MYYIDKNTKNLKIYILYRNFYFKIKKKTFKNKNKIKFKKKMA